MTEMMNHKTLMTKEQRHLRERERERAGALKLYSSIIPLQSICDCVRSHLLSAPGGVGLDFKVEGRMTDRCVCPLLMESLCRNLS